MKSYINKIFKVTLLIGFLVVTHSCGEEFLTQVPLDKLSTETYFKSDAEFIAATNGVYDAMIKRNEAEFVAMFDMATPFADCGGEFRFAMYQPRRNNGVLAIDDTYWGSVTMWPIFYNIVERANVVLDKIDVDEPDVSEAILNRCEGECRFLRAYAYFNLVQLFGDVPLITGYLPYNELQQPRAPKAEVYNQIIEDLTIASEKLPSVTKYRGTAELGRASKGAAQSLLGKTYLFMKDYSNAEIWLDKVINSGDYELERYYVDLFWPDNENGIESIFEVQYNSNDPSGGDDRNRWPQYAGFEMASNTYWSNGWRYMEPTEYYCDQFETKKGYKVTSKFIKQLKNEDMPEGINFQYSFISDDPDMEFSDPYEIRDPRLKWTVWYDNTSYIEEDFAERGLCPNANFKMGYSRFSNHCSVKYLTGKVSPQDESDMNMIVIRFADVLLMAAEAKLEQDKLGPAVDLINRVRQRPSVSMPTIEEVGQVQGIDIAGSQENLRQYMREERYRELAFEWGHMYYDQIRWGIFDDEMEKFWVNGRDGWTNPDFVWNDAWWLWPIPGDEFARNKHLIQNPGY